MPTQAPSDADIIHDAYAEKLKTLYDTFFLTLVQSPGDAEPARDAFVRGVVLARKVRDMAIDALPADGAAAS